MAVGLCGVTDGGRAAAAAAAAAVERGRAKRRARPGRGQRRAATASETRRLRRIFRAREPKRAQLPLFDSAPASCQLAVRVPRSSQQQKQARCRAVRSQQRASAHSHILNTGCRIRGNGPGRLRRGVLVAAAAASAAPATTRFQETVYGPRRWCRVGCRSNSRTSSGPSSCCRG
jgi:hypothetical protein